MTSFSLYNCQESNYQSNSLLIISFLISSLMLQVSNCQLNLHILYARITLAQGYTASTKETDSLVQPPPNQVSHDRNISKKKINSNKEFVRVTS